VLSIACASKRSRSTDQGDPSTPDQTSDDSVLASVCQGIEACSLANGNCSDFGSDNPSSGLACVCAANGNLYACSAPTADGLAGEVITDGAFDVVTVAGTCTEEAAAGASAGPDIRLASSNLGKCNGGGDERSHGPN
jgi:hypothetical protein